ncbi:MAG: HesA/MoeB/ThiF family protein [Candidatus Odinarchaeia archaeon]
MKRDILSDDEKIRYDRQLKIENWGIEKQIKLKNAKIVVIGAGGLGSPAAIYLTAAGVGNILLVDNDKYELSNLNRQILATTEDIGKNKAEVGAEKLRALNPEINIESLTTTLNENNIKEIIKDATVVLDALDNWKTRFLINQYCVQSDIPLIHGGVTELGGQVITIIPKKGPCLNCLFKNVPEEKKGFAVVGVTPGIIGTIQALEAIKLITGIGTTLWNRILVFDGYESTFDYIPVKRNVNCDVCGEHLK